MTGNCSGIWTWRAFVMGAFFYSQRNQMDFYFSRRGSGESG